MGSSGKILFTVWICRQIYMYLFFFYLYFQSAIFEKRNCKPIFQTLITLICWQILFGDTRTSYFFLLIFLSKYFYLYMIKPDRKVLILVLFLNLLPWIKNEGYLLTCVFSFSLIILLKLFSNKIDIVIFVIFSFLFVIFKQYIL